MSSVHNLLREKSGVSRRRVSVYTYSINIKYMAILNRFKYYSYH